jgi:hypothetical protein
MRMPYPKFAYCFLLSAFFFLSSAHAQLSCKGKVIDERGDVAIPHASVYFNNTTIATETDAQGEFRFDNIRFFNTELVIVSPGYEVFVYKPTAAQLAAKKFVLKMRSKNTLSNKRPDMPDKAAYGEAFKRGLLGITNEAAHSTINNLQAVYFEDDSTGSTNAFADTTLEIINNLCGYKMHYNMVMFTYDAYNGQAYYTGYCRYESLGEGPEFQLSRNHCYFGSSQHFYRSLIANKLYEEGFGVFVKAAPQPGHPADEDLYRPVTTTQVLWIDSMNNYSIGIKDKLVVQYNRNPVTKNYLRTILDFVNGDLKKGIEGSIDVKRAPVELTSVGMPVDDSELEYGSFWSYEKLANTLPLDYLPDEKPMK